MGICKKIRSFICFFDTYATSFHVQFREKSTFQTNLGGVISTILLLLGLAALIFLYVYFENRDEFRIVTFDIRDTQPPQFKISLDVNKVNYSYDNIQEGFFMIGLFFYNANDKKVLTLNDMETFFEFQFEEVIKEKDKEDVKNPLIFIDCETKYPNITAFLNFEILKKSYCLDNEVIVEGEFINQIYRYTLVRFKYKKFALDNKEVNNIRIYVVKTDFSIQKEIKNKSPIKYVAKLTEITINNEEQYESNIFIAMNEFYSNDNIYAPWGTRKVQKCLRIDKMISTTKDMDKPAKPEDNPKAVSLFFRSSIHYERYNRTYKNFFDVICQIGGLWKVLMLIGAIIVVPINLGLMNVSISNKLFNMVHPNNEADVRMTYEEFLAKEERYGKVPEIFQSLNPLLKKISIDYYKYERNKGLDFTAKEALEKMCCCCCQITSLREKDKIFDSSRQEIDNRLDTVAVAKFAQELKAIKKILLYNSSACLDHVEKVFIDYDSIDKIREDANDQAMFASAKPISLVYYKQNNLVSAFNILRNQGDLTKTDLLLLKLFNINPDLILKFFITYTDRFALIYPDRFPKKSINENKKTHHKRSSLSSLKNIPPINPPDNPNPDNNEDSNKKTDKIKIKAKKPTKPNQVSLDLQSYQQIRSPPTKKRSSKTCLKDDMK